MPMLSLPDTTIFYSVHGSGPPMLLHHGWCCDGSDWAWMIPALAAHYTVIVMDSRGHGRSSPAPTYGFDKLVGDVEAVLLAATDQPAVVVGHSMGGVVLSGLALRRPDLVRALVAIDPAYGHPPEFAGRVAEMTGFMATRPANAAEVVSGIFGSWAGAGAPDFLEPFLVRRVMAMEADAISGTLVGLDELPVSPRETADPILRSRPCPVLSFHSFPGSAEWEAGTFSHPLSQAVPVSDVGHWLHIERAPAITAQMIAWLAELGAAEPRA